MRRPHSAEVSAGNPLMVERFIAQFGYVGVFLGTFLEGETFILLGGFLAHQGHLGFWRVILVATLGAFAGDQTYFALGRHYGRSWFEKNKRARKVLPWLERFMDRYHSLSVFLVRYLYGMRWLAASLAGSCKVGFFRFALLSAPACLIWALVVGTLGYGAGEAVERLIGDLKRYEVYLFVLVVVIGATYGLVLYVQERRLERPE